MTGVAWIFALIGAAVHLLAFAWEVLLFDRPGVHRGIFAIPTTDVPAVGSGRSTSVSTTSSSAAERLRA